MVALVGSACAGSRTGAGAGMSSSASDAGTMSPPSVGTGTGQSPKDGSSPQSPSLPPLGPGQEPSPAQGQTCADGKCPPGLTCIAYYGIAGTKGPKFDSCEIPCQEQKPICPAGQNCVVISDGPGSVCRPSDM